MSTTLLVTGIHRDELAFGDRVAGLLKHDCVDLMRIPQGIARARSGNDAEFYDTARHREIYLQLRQQIKGRYQLLIDLHCGSGPETPCADIYCANTGFLHCIEQQAGTKRVRPINIVETIEQRTPFRPRGRSSISAYTWIPRQIWDDLDCLYVGIEIYLAQEGEGSQTDWLFSLDLINDIQNCHPEK